MEGKEVQRLVVWLKEQAATISCLEKKAHEALYLTKDKDLHKKIMVEKAELLSRIALDARPYCKALPAQTDELVRGTLQSFSQNAQQSLQIDSIFYMSALLYPDEHKTGEPNNLERFITKLEE